MGAEGCVRLQVALEVDGEPVRGTVCDGVLPPVEFTGWLELMSVFETALARAAASTGAGL